MHSVDAELALECVCEWLPYYRTPSSKNGKHPFSEMYAKDILYSLYRIYVIELALF